MSVESSNVRPESSGHGNTCEERGPGRTFGWARFVARNRLVRFNSRKERGGFEPTCGTDWNDKNSGRFRLSLEASLCLCPSALFPIGYVAKLPQIHWSKTTIAIYLLAHDAVIWEGMGRDGSSLLHEVLADQPDWGWRLWMASLTCLASRLRCPEELGVGQANLFSKVSLHGGSGLQER